MDRRGAHACRPAAGPRPRPDAGGSGHAPPRWLSWRRWPGSVGAGRAARVASVPLVTRFAVQPTLAAGVNAFAVSPDGREIAFTGSQQMGGEPQLFVRRLDQFDEIPVAGTGCASMPFYSPDGQWIGFAAGRRLLKVNLRAGTAPVSLCECVGRASATASPGSETAASSSRATNRGLRRIAAEGGEPSALTTRTRRTSTITIPRRFPGGGRCCSPHTGRTGRSRSKP